jgi:hypothetical protein
MPLRLRWIAGVATLAAALAGPAWAHHSVSGQFDLGRRVTLTGTIAEVDWINPHIYVHLNVPGDGGAMTSWRLETAPPAMMQKAGLTKEMLMGDGGAVVVEGYPGREAGQNIGFILKITYADGHYYLLSADR